MKILKKLLTLDEFKKYIKGKDFYPNRPNKLIIHHTWKPVQSTWNGAKTIDGLKKYYEGKGWSNGPHIFVAPDGIWLFTDMKQQGIHAGDGNYRSIGIEVVGNYDGAKWTGSIKRNALGVIDSLMKELDLDYLDLYPHRFYNKTKTCPGKAIAMKWIEEKIRDMREDNKNETKPSPVEAVDGDTVEIVEDEPKTPEKPISEPHSDSAVEFKEAEGNKLIIKVNYMEKVKAFFLSKEFETALWHSGDLMLSALIVYLGGLSLWWAVAILPVLTYMSKYINVTYIKK